MYKIQLLCVKQSKNKLSKKENTMKKIVGAVLIASVFGESGAYALCVEDCGSANIGIGGLYSKFNGSNAGVESIGGYLSLGYYKITSRIKSGIVLEIGTGSSKLFGTALNGLENSSNLFYSITPKIGVNIASKNMPIFINLVIEGDDHNTTGRAKGIERRFISLGGEIEGVIPMGNVLSITYSAGYGWLGYAHYKFDGADSRVGDGANYMIKASVGASYVLSDSVSTYLRLIGRYYNTAKNSAQVQIQNNNVSYPASSSYVGMVELGLEF